MMKYQYLAVVFVIIMLPISLVFSAYIGAQLNTLDLQISYDSKLDNSTYDAIKAFQLNTVNSTTSDLVNSKIRDIEAAANSFFTSIATNFNMVGYNSEVLQSYVPALVFTLYDGFYIYSPFENILDDEIQKSLENNSNATYKGTETITGLKPYIYYSCRYVHGQIDVTITYSLDNYITVQGTDKNGKAINDAGYLLDNVTYNETNGEVKYRGIAIDYEEPLKERVGDREYEYIKINGVKYYKESENLWFTLSNGRKTYLASTASFRGGENNMGYLYYKEAYDFRERLDGYGILELESDDARGPDGNPLSPITDKDGNVIYDFTGGSYKIFDFGGTSSSIEEKDSNFNDHRLAVIRYVIENNLAVALSNYNKYVSGTYEFRLPKLEEEDWTKILSNVCLISFLQGLSIGGKIYNGYSVINNNKNEEVVTEDSIYIVEDITINSHINTLDNSTYHRIIHKGLENIITDNSRGVFNIDFERKALGSDTRETTLYYLPRVDLGCYTCFVAQTNVNSGYDNVYAYLDDISRSANGEKLAKLYYTALGRERYSMYKVFRNAVEHVNQFR